MTTLKKWTIRILITVLIVFVLFKIGMKPNTNDEIAVIMCEYKPDKDTEVVKKHGVFRILD